MTYPPTKRTTDSDTYESAVRGHVLVTDSYRWLEHESGRRADYNFSLALTSVLTYVGPNFVFGRSFRPFCGPEESRRHRQTEG
jgi:hypothetical protein